jgi:hypothetical protein
MSDKETEKLVLKIERYLRAASMSATRFGYLSIGDPALVCDLRRGRKLRTGTVEKIQKFMERGQ